MLGSKGGFCFILKETMVSIQVQGKFSYPTPAAKESCKPTSEKFFVIMSAAEGDNSVPVLNLRIPLAEFDFIEDARLCADTITRALAQGKKPTFSV